MHESSLAALQRMRPTLRKRWEVLLRAEPVSSPLGTPEALVHLMDWTLDRVFDAIGQIPARRKQKTRSSHDYRQPADLCECGLNPLLAYFTTGERALLEAVFLADSPLPPLTPGERQTFAADLQQALHAIARVEIETLCSLCQRRPCEQVRGDEVTASAR